MEAEKQMLKTKDTLLQAALPVGLPPKHYGALYRKFEDYFMNRGVQQFTYKGIPYRLRSWKPPPSHRNFQFHWTMRLP